MENNIKITKDLKFNYDDLMRKVDVSQEFTLRDIINACINSSIPFKTLSRILRCNYLKDYIKEVNSKPFENERNIDYLEVYWWGSKQTDDGKRDDGNIWSFHGIGKKGDVPEDVLKYGKLSKKEKEDYRSAMAIEFDPLYYLADLPIKIGKKLHITDYDVKCCKDWDSNVDFQPSITLIELLHAIFWELSFCGSPEQRDSQMKELNRRVDEIDKAGKEGRLDEIMVPWEKVKKDMLKKVKDIKKEKKNGLQLR